MALNYQALQQLYNQSLYGGMDPLAYSYMMNQNAANQANEARYGDIISGLTGIYNRNMDRITSLGDQERSDINRRANQNKAAALSDAVARGYGASTVRNSLANKAEEDRSRALSQFRDQEIMRQIQTDSSLANNVYGAMERRNDVQPNLSNMVNVNQALGAAGGAYPSVGGGYGGGFGQIGSPQFPGVTGGQYTTMGNTNYGPGSGGAGRAGMTPSYPLPGGGSTTPLPLPQSLYGNYGPGMGGAGTGDKRLQQQLRHAMLREINAYARPQQNQQNQSSNSSKPFIRATGDLGGSLPTYNRAPWQNQDISFGGPSVGGAYGIPGMPVNIGSYQQSVGYSGGYGNMGPGSGGAGRTGYQRPRPTPRQTNIPVSRPRSSYRAPNGMSQSSSGSPGRTVNWPAGGPMMYGATFGVNPNELIAWQ